MNAIRAAGTSCEAAGHAYTAGVINHVATVVKFVPQSGVELFYVLSGVVLLRPYVRGQRPFRWGATPPAASSGCFPPISSA